MARPLRIEYPGAIYHITSRGNRKADIFLGKHDRLLFLEIFEQTVDRYNWLCHAYCLMNNHYHLMIETPDPNLSQGMRQLNGMYTQYFNKANDSVGHLFQGRYKSIVVDKDAYLLELCRYIVNNPVKAGLCRAPGDWNWSSYGPTALGKSLPSFLTVEWVLGQFSDTLQEARKRYREFVKAGLKNDSSPWDNLENQSICGSQEFAESIRSLTDAMRHKKEIPVAQRMVGRPPLAHLFLDKGQLDTRQRNTLIVMAHIEHGYRQKEIADYLALHYSTVSRVIAKQTKKSKIKT